MSAPGDASAAAVLEEAVASLGALVLRRVAPGRFVALGAVPAWARSVWGEAPFEAEAFDPGEHSPFLECFLPDAEALWEGGAEGRLGSGIWTEDGTAGEAWNFDAQAILLAGGEQVLLVQQLDRSFEELFHLLQQARRASLDHHQLRREIDKKEVLLHCIVHDLKGPLSGMMGGYSLLKSRRLTPERLEQLVEIGLRHARRQNAMIQSILDVFSAELADFERFERGTRAPSLRACATELVTSHRASFLEAGVQVRLVVDAEEGDDLRVVGNPRRLTRVLMNLVENAVRHSPRRGEVVLRLIADGADVFLEVEDRGPGIEPERVETLFERFVGEGSGSAGLGLYFCRLVAEQWGGEIGYVPREGGGARFRVRLPRAE